LFTLKIPGVFPAEHLHEIFLPQVFYPGSRTYSSLVYPCFVPEAKRNNCAGRAQLQFRFIPALRAGNLVRTYGCRATSAINALQRFPCELLHCSVHGIGTLLDDMASSHTQHV